MTAILGISAFYHDSAAALVVDGDIVAAVQEERFTREKYDARFPTHAIRYCLDESGLEPAQLDYVVFYDKPFSKFERLLETYFAFAPHGLRSFKMAIPLWLREKLYTRRTIAREMGRSCRASMVFLDHHESHAASAFFPSPFEEAAILTLDGVGEWATTTCGLGVSNSISLTHQLQFPHSLGLLYAAFTYYCGFKVNSGEYKLMGLAPYGRALYQDRIRERLIDLKADGSFWLDMKYFNYCQGLTMTNERFHDLFGGPPREPESPLLQRHMDLAASIQAVTEEAILRLGRSVHEQTGMKNLVLAGGVALNCVANGRLLREGPFENIWVQPAAGDAGGALGSALFVWHQLLKKPRTVCRYDAQKASLLGPAFTDTAIRSFLDQKGATYRCIPDEQTLIDHTAGLLADGKVVGWFHGRAEFGPRALGARSILGDPRLPDMQATMNVKIKFRESFRPFAPCVLREHAHEWFNVRPCEDSAYMLMVAPILRERRVALSDGQQEMLRSDPDLSRRVNVARSTVPAITHVDYSARIQTVDHRHGRFYRLLKKFHERTGCPILVNTSFNLSWEPIVLTPEEAYQSFMLSDMDALVLENCVLHKADQVLGLRPWSTPGEDHLAQPDNPWADPVTREPLVMTPREARNPVTGTRYPVEDGIPRLFVPTDPADAAGRDVTEIVKQFYEETPFPNYDDVDNRRALIDKARSGLFARLLNEQIPYNARVVEIGCGTGQLTNFLAIAQRTVIGTDLCLNSLQLAQRFRSANALERATFAQMNLFRPALKDGFFDVVISNGVLHHTADPRQAFARIVRLLKPGGYFVVGLYSAYSRKLHDARRLLFQWTGITPRWLDPHLAELTVAGRREAWFRDQYCHPHESCHTIDQMLEWMDENDCEFTNSIPKPRNGPVLTAGERVFERRDPGTALTRFLSQVTNMASGYREGGFFVVIGRRRGEGATA